MHTLEWTETFERNPRDGDKFHIADAEIAFEGKVTWDGKELPATAIEYLLSYGVRQATADKWSAAASQGQGREGCIQIYEARVASYFDESFAERSSTGSAPVDPVAALATKNAKLDITARLKAASGKTKIADIYAELDVAKKYFTTAKSDDTRYVWLESEVANYIQRMAEQNKRDYYAEAKAVIENADDALGDL